MEIDVWNMPINTLYRFDTNKYVWSTLLSETRGGKHKEKTPFSVTEVYEFTNEGYIKLLSSGGLKKTNDENEFEIFDFDNETTTRFRATIRLQPIGINELMELREAIARNYRKMNK